MFVAPRPTRGKRLRALEAVERFLPRVGLTEAHASIWRDELGREEIVVHFVPSATVSHVGAAVNHVRAGGGGFSKFFFRGAETRMTNVRKGGDGGYISQEWA